MSVRKRRHDTPRIVKYFLEHPGLHVHVQELEHILDRKDTVNVLALMSTIINKEILPGLQKVKAGGPYVYIPNKDKPAPVAESKPEDELEIFEKIGETKTGQPVLRDTKGVLYRASFLE